MIKTKNSSLLMFIIGLGSASCSYHQDEYGLKSVVHNECIGKAITFFGLKLKYPLTVQEAIKEYGLNYKSNGIFYKTISPLPRVNSSVPYNFSLIYVKKLNDGYRDQVPDSLYHDRLVKGYSFLIKTRYDFDSLRNSLQKQFGRKFERKRQTVPEAFQKYNYNPKQYAYEMCISECTYIVLSDFKSGSYEFLAFYFDMSEEERTLFYH